MTAKELIKESQKLSPDTKIVIRGYEDGYNDILKLMERGHIPHHGQKECWNGEYEDSENTGSSQPAVELWVIAQKQRVKSNQARSYL